MSASISKLKVAELKEQLEARGLPTDGKKDDLVARLTQTIEAEEGEGKNGQQTEATQGTQETPGAAAVQTEAPPSPKKHAAAEATAPGTVEADEAPKKFTPIQWVAPEPAAKPATSTEPTAAPAHGSAAEGEKAFAEMTEAEKIIARAKKYGTPVDEKALQAAKLQERAKRFNLESTEAATKGAAGSSTQAKAGSIAKSTIEVDLETLKKRQERFQTSNPQVAAKIAAAEEEEKRKMRMEKFGIVEPVAENPNKKRKV